MRVHALVLAAAMVGSLLAGCTSPADAERVENPLEPCGALDTDYSPDQAYMPRVQVETSNGTFVIGLYMSQVPLTAGNFLELVRKDFYEDTRFHKLVEGEFIQGGDPLSGNDERRDIWGTGGPGYRFPPTFHQFLRHDEPGIVSMAQGRPNQAGSQFIVDISPQPDFNDRQPVIGKVLQGMDVVEAIAKTPTDDRDRPKFGAKLFETQAFFPPENRANASVRLTSYGFDCVQAAEPGGKAEFLTLVRNTGQGVFNGTISSDLAGNWSLELRNAERTVAPSGQTSTQILDVQVPEGASEGTHTFNVTWSAADTDVKTTLELSVNVGSLGPKPERGDAVSVRYVGVLEDGRPFDTTVEAYADSPSLTWFREPPQHLAEVDLQVGSGQFVGQQATVVDGMKNLLNRANVGQSVVAEVAPSDAYGTKSFGKNNLGGRLLVFQLEITGQKR